MKNTKLITLIFGLVFTFIFLLPLNIYGQSFWMDNNGLIDVGENFFKYFHVWNDNLLGILSTSSYSSTPHYFIVWFFNILFGFNYFSYSIFFFTIFLIYIYGEKIVNLFIKNKILSLVFSLIFIFNLPILRFFYGQGTYTFLLGFLGLLITFYYLLIYKLHHKNIYLIYIILSSLLVSHPFLFCFYVLILISFLLFYNKISFKKIFLIIFGIIFLNFSWIFQFIYGTKLSYNSFESDYSTGLVKVFSSNSQLYNSLFFLGKNYDYIKEFFNNSSFIIINIYFTLWVAFIYTIFYHKKKYNDLYIILISLLLILLGFSVGSREPIGLIYNYLYNNIGLFSVFRTFSNVLPFMFMIFIIILLLNGNKKLFKFIGLLNFLFIFTFLYSISINNYTKTINFPKDYINIKNIIDSNSSRGNILILPCSTYDFYIWDKNQDKYFLESFFKNNGVVFYRPNLSVIKELNNIGKKICNQKKLDVNFYNKYNINYIIYRKDLKFKELNYYNDLNINSLNHEDNILKKIYSGSFVDLYYINLPKTSSFKKINPIRYNININIPKLGYLEIINLNSFNKGRKLFPSSKNINCSVDKQQKYNSYSPASGQVLTGNYITLTSGDRYYDIYRKYSKTIWGIQDYNDKNILFAGSGDKIMLGYKYTTGTVMKQTGTGNITECINDGYKFFEGDELGFLTQKPVFDETHKLVNDYANGWTLDAETIKKTFPKDSYSINPDGSLNVNLTLYFRPQSWFYVGLGISGFTLLTLLLWLLLDTFRKPKIFSTKNENEHTAKTSANTTKVSRKHKNNG